VIGRVLHWVRESLAFRVVVVFVLSGALTDWASSKAWVSGWDHPGRSGKFDVLFLIPFAMAWGFGCAMFLVKHSPRSFLSEDEVSGDPDDLRRAREDWPVFVFGFVAWGFVAALPIVLIAWGLSELGLES
jgi:hypothetical protein